GRTLAAVSDVPAVHIPDVHVQVEERPPRWGLGDAALGCLIGWLLAGLIVIVFVGPTRHPQLSLAVIALSEVGLWAGLLGVPIVEELFFRGLVLRSLLRRWGPTASVIGSAVVFGVVHLELLQLPALVVLGLVLGVLVVRTGRLGPSIWAHGAFNAVTVVSLAL